MPKTRQRFQEEIDQLVEDTFDMASLAKKMIGDSVSALINKDKKKSEKIINLDDEMDDYFHDIEKRSIQLIATQQPMAKDLRLIAGLLRIISDIERMGDYSVDIAKGVNYLTRPLTSGSSVKLTYMVKIILEMLDNSLTPLKNKKLNDLEKIVSKDELIDKNFGKICDHVVDKLIENKSESHGQHEITVLLAGRHLERVADHITNICERVHYIITGDMVELHND